MFTSKEICGFQTDLDNYLKLVSQSTKNEKILAEIDKETVKAIYADKENYCSTLRYLIMLLKELSKTEEYNLLSQNAFSFYFHGNSRFVVFFNKIFLLN